MTQLVNILKVGVLLVSHIRKRGTIRSKIVTRRAQRFTLLLLAFVLPLERISKDEEESELHAVCDEKRANAEMV